jgi:hypothetical protein
MISGNTDPPRHYITEPLRSFAPEKLENGDIRMAIAKAGQKAYNSWGEEATLTKDFLSKDSGTWDDGLVSINHENNNEWVKATLYDPVYDSKTDLVICSFSGLPDWAKSLIYSEDYRGLSQECIPVKFAKNSNDVIRGFGTGVTIVTAPYEPAANQGMGVGIRPELAAILASKYPSQIEDTMTNNNGGGTPAITSEEYASIVSEKVELKSQIMALESNLKKKDEELVSWKQKYADLESGEANRVKIAIESARANWEMDLKSKAERETAVSELNTVMSKDAAESYLSTNPTLEQIKSITGILKAGASRNVGASSSQQVTDDERESAEAEEAWKSSHVRL